MGLFLRHSLRESFPSQKHRLGESETTLSQSLSSARQTTKVGTR